MLSFLRVRSLLALLFFLCLSFFLSLSRYVDILQPGPTRRDLLRDHFFFDCSCRRCCPGPPLAPPLPPSGTPPSSSWPLFFPEDDLVSGGWVCPKRSCCGRGTILPWGVSAAVTAATAQTSPIKSRGGIVEDRVCNQGGNLCMVSPGTCSSCGGVTGEAYFDRWTELLGTKLTSADLDLERGHVSEGRTKLENLAVR